MTWSFPSCCWALCYLLSQECSSPSLHVEFFSLQISAEVSPPERTSDHSLYKVAHSAPLHVLSLIPISIPFIFFMTQQSSILSSFLSFPLSPHPRLKAQWGQGFLSSLFTTEIVRKSSLRSETKQSPQKEIGTTVTNILRSNPSTWLWKPFTTWPTQPSQSSSSLTHQDTLCT